MYNWLDEVIFLLCLTIEEFLNCFIMGLVVFITILTYLICILPNNSLVVEMVDSFISFDFLVYFEYYFIVLLLKLVQMVWMSMRVFFLFDCS